MQTVSLRPSQPVVTTFKAPGKHHPQVAFAAAPAAQRPLGLKQLLLAALLVLPACATSGTPQPEVAVPSKQALAEAPKAALPSLEVLDVTEATFQKEVVEASRKQPVVVNFWSPRLEMQNFKGNGTSFNQQLKEAVGSLAQKLDGKITVVRINVDETPRLKKYTYSAGNPEQQPSFVLVANEFIRAKNLGYGWPKGEEFWLDPEVLSQFYPKK